MLFLFFLSRKSFFGPGVTTGDSLYFTSNTFGHYQPHVFYWKYVFNLMDFDFWLIWTI